MGANFVTALTKILNAAAEAGPWPAMALTLGLTFLVLAMALLFFAIGHH